MASVFGHVASAFGLGKLFPKKIMTRKVFVLGMVASILPDLDVLAYHFQIYGNSMWAHRGITHSLFAALLWAFILVVVFHRKKAHQLLLGTYYFLATASHGLFDAMTTGGDGITFFAPFSEERYFLPFRMIRVSPIGISEFFSEWGVKVLQSEFIWIGIPTILMILLGAFLNKRVYA